MLGSWTRRLSDMWVYFILKTSNSCTLSYPFPSNSVRRVGMSLEGKRVRESLRTQSQKP